MAFLRRNRSQPILPGNVAALLAEYGEHDFGTGQLPSSETVMLFASFQNPATQERATEAVREMRDAAIAAGGWAVYGASSAVLAFFPMEAESEPAQELFDARIIFLHGLRLPDIRAHLGAADASRWKKLYPGELG